MKILNKLTITDLKLNKKRTIGTIIGIVLATALITVVGGMFYVVQNTIVQESIDMTGYYHVIVNGIDNDEINKIKKDKTFSHNETIKDLGNVKNSLDEYDYYDYNLYSMTSDTADYLKINISEGSFPNTNTEIAVDYSYIRDNNVKIGDTVSLVFENNTLKSYKIVGITSRYGMIITTNTDSNNNIMFLALKHPKNYKRDISKFLGVDDYTKDSGSKYDYNVNKELLMWEAGAFGDSVMKVIYGIFGIIIGIILITSVFSIRNSFAISVNEKTKTYGMLASIGATKKQIRRMVLLEGLYLGLIGIIIGLVLGNGIVYLLTVIVNALAKSGSLLSSGNLLYYKFSIYPTFIAIIVSVIMIYLSTITSSIKAGLTSPIQNIRNSEKIKNRKLRVPFSIRKIFKIGGVLSYKNLKRSKKKYRVTVISLTVSIFIFIVTSSFLQYGLKTIRDQYKSYYHDLSVENLADTNIDTSKLLGLGKYHAKYVIMDNEEDFYYHDYRIKDVSHVMLDDYKQSEDYYGDYGEKINYQYFRYKMMIYDDNSFKEYCNEIGIDYNANKDKAILIDTVRRDKKDIRITNYKENDSLIFTDTNYPISFSYQIAKVTDKRLWGLEANDIGDVVIIVDKEYFKIDDKLKIDEIYYETDNAKKLEDDIYNISKDLYVNNISEGVKQTRTIVLIFSIFIYGFIIVVTFIGITSVFNTINSNMELRRREFATLKSIGMTKKEFNNMILLESIFYSFKSLFIGILLGIMGSQLVYQIFKKNVDFGYILPLKSIIISIIFIVSLVYIIMHYSISRINKENIIETIRKENI